MTTIESLLLLLDNLHSAEEYGATTQNDDWYIPFQAALDAIYDVAPDWFNAASYDGGLHGTGLAGDPSEWDLGAVAELRIMLAIGSL